MAEATGGDAQDLQTRSDASRAEGSLALCRSLGGQELGSESRQLDSRFPLHLPLAVLSAAPQPPPGDECL